MVPTFNPDEHLEISALRCLTFKNKSLVYITQKLDQRCTRLPDMSFSNNLKRRLHFVLPFIKDFRNVQKETSEIH